MDVLGVRRVHIATDDGGVLAVATAGDIADRSRPLAVLQHGFPDTPATWRHLAPLLVAAGHRVAMPWLRGYEPSQRGDQPSTIDRYAADLQAVHDHLGGDGRAVLIGHDWGAAAAWVAAADGPWRAVVGIAVPPQPAMHGFLTDLDQLWRSRYMVQASLPVARWILRQDLRPLIDLWRRWSPGRVPDSADLQPLRRALPTVTAVRAALAPYRELAVPGVLHRVPAADGHVPRQPSLLVHGIDDRCLDKRYALRARSMLADANPRSSVWLVEGAGHFVQLEQPELVCDAILSFLERT